MNFNDIEIGQQYMIYEDNVGRVEVIGKHVVGGREIIWFKQNNTHRTAEAKHFSSLPISHNEAVRNFNTKLMTFTDRPHTADELHVFLDVELMNLINDFESGKIDW